MPIDVPTAIHQGEPRGMLSAARGATPGDKAVWLTAADTIAEHADNRRNSAGVTGERRAVVSAC
jgi:hypothetical protein